MGTLTPTLTLNDSNTFSDTINFTVTDSLTTGTPSQGLTKATITTADNQELVDDGESGVFYFYAKNTLAPINFILVFYNYFINYTIFVLYFNIIRSRMQSGYI